jgi:hypothetical protein
MVSRILITLAVVIITSLAPLAHAQLFPFAFLRSTPPTGGGGGFFVLTSNSFLGGFGGLSGADATCLSELQANNWKNKAGATLNSTTVKAFLCNDSTCVNPLPNTVYTFAKAGDITAGGATFTTNASGQGPGDSADWSGLTYFNGAAEYWSGRTGGTGTLWGLTSTGQTCLNWTSGIDSEFGSMGITSGTSTTRFSNNTYDCFQGGALICIVNPP